MSEQKIHPKVLKLFTKTTGSLIGIFQKKQTDDKIENFKYDSGNVEQILCRKSPFIYLTEKEQNDLLKQVTFIQYNRQMQEVLQPEQNNEYSCYVVMEGQLMVVHKNKQDSEILERGDSFGIDACLFSVSEYNVITCSATSVVVMKISKKTLEGLLSPDKQFTVMVGSNLLNKQRIFAPIDKFRDYVADCVTTGTINMQKLLKAYKAIDSSCHPKRKSEDLDIFAWRQAVQKLPSNLCESFVYFITTTLPDMQEYEKHEGFLMEEIKTQGREREIYLMLAGKNYIIVRDLVSDINDLLSNLCIHIIECKKLRYKMKSPQFLMDLITHNSLDGLPLKPEEKQGLIKIWGKENAVAKIKNINMHHEDYKISFFVPSCHLKQSPSELWTEKIWKNILEALGEQISVVEAIEKGLVVDFMQGSTRSILNAISPYIYQNSEKITKWFNQKGLSLKSSDLHDPRDKLIAMSYYYFKEFPEEERRRRELDRLSGVVTNLEKNSTGVKSIVININKLSKINNAFDAKSDYHILLYIGFTFGKQSYDLIKSINLLLGKALNSYTFIGKAGGLIGYRNDILVATRFFDEMSKSEVRTNYHGISQSLLQKETDSIVRFGPILTVSGNVLQNNKMLLYYKHIEGCIGTEMEGAYISMCIKHSIEAGIIREDVATRFIYYVSELPLLPDNGVANEEEGANWDEGLKSMNGIIRYVIGLLYKKEPNDMSSETKVKLESLCKNHENNIIVIGTNTESINILNHNIASELAEILLLRKFTVIYLTPEDGIKPFMRKISQPYLEKHEFIPEEVAKDLRKQSKYIDKNKLLIIEYISYSEYLNKLHCIADIVKKLDYVPFLFADTVGGLEVINSLSGSEINRIKSNFETLKISCPKSTLMFFRTDLDNGVVNQKTLLTSLRFDYIFTRYKEMDSVVIVPAVPLAEMKAENSEEVISNVLRILDYTNTRIHKRDSLIYS